MSNLVLYHYWRSSSSWRVRWALEHKGLQAKFVPVNLLDGESESPAHLDRNPFGYVPVLEVDGRKLIESVAILEWLEETFPRPSLYPGDSFQRAHIRALVEAINAGTQPVQNLTVMDFYSSDEQKRKAWNQHFIRRGLDGYQKLAAPRAGKFSVADQVTAADLYLIPQCYNAIRFGVPLAEFPLLEKIYAEAILLPQVKATAPERFEPPKN